MTGGWRRYRTGLALACMALLWAAPLCAFTVTARAEPDRVRAGERATSMITVEVLDGVTPAPDHTEVRFLTTLGTITPAVYTSHGQARALLTCGSTGTAEVSVMVGADRAVVLVEFGAEAGSGEGASRSIHIDGGWVAYSSERQIVSATDGATFRYRRMTVKAQALQYELGTGVLHAQRQVTITNGHKTIEGERLCYWPNQARGIMLAAKEDVVRIFFQGEDLSDAPRGGQVSNATFQPPDLEGTNTWIVAESVLIIPSERIQFSRASIYVKDRQVLSLPYYITSFSSPGNAMNSIFGFSSNGGLNIDFPLYYAASEQRVGSLHIRRGAGSGFSYGSTDANNWSLGVEEQYKIGQGGRGLLSLDNITDSTRGFRLRHTQELGGAARADLNIGYYRYDPSYPGALTGQLYVYHPVKKLDLNTSVRANRYGTATDWGLETTARYGGSLPGKLTYTLNGSVGFGSSMAGYYSVGGDGERKRNALTYGIGGLLNFPTKELGKRTTFTSSVGVQANAGGLYGRTSADLRMGLRRSLGQTGTVSLDYTYSLQSGQSYYYGGGQRLDLNLYASRGRQWYSSLYGSMNIDDGSLFGSAWLSYTLPFDKRPDGSGKWRAELRGSYSKFAGYGMDDIRFALGRDIGRYEVLLCYSPSGNGYSGYGVGGIGGGSGRKVWLELAAGSF